MTTAPEEAEPRRERKTRRKNRGVVCFLLVVASSLVGSLAAGEQLSYADLASRLSNLERLAVLPERGEIAGQNFLFSATPSDSTGGPAVLQKRAPAELAAFHGAVFIPGEFASFGEELWTSEGSPEEAVVFVDINPGVNRFSVSRHDGSELYRGLECKQRHGNRHLRPDLADQFSLRGWPAPAPPFPECDPETSETDQAFGCSNPTVTCL